MSKHASSGTVTLSWNSVLALFLGLLLSLGYAALQGAAVYIFLPLTNLHHVQTETCEWMTLCCLMPVSTDNE